MMQMLTEPQKWEVWYAMVFFEDNPTVGKKRPVIVCGSDEVYIIAYKVTGRPVEHEMEYALLDLQDAGLDVESTVILSKKLQIIRSDMLVKLGRLSVRDMMRIKVKLM